MRRRGVLISRQHRHLVQEPAGRQRFDAKRHRALRGLTSFTKAAKTAIGVREVRIRKTVRRISADRFVSLVERQIEAAEKIVAQREAVDGLVFGWKGTFPVFERPGGLSLIAAHLEVELIIN